MKNTHYRPAGGFTREVEQYEAWLSNANPWQKIGLKVAHALDNHRNPRSTHGLAKKVDLFSERNDLSVGQLDAIITAAQIRNSRKSGTLNDEQYSLLYSVDRNLFYINERT